MTTAMERDIATSGGVNGSPQGQLQEAATGLMEQAARTADAQASTTMTRVGETLETVANHIREAGEELRAEQPQIAGLIETAAERVNGAATYLRDRDASEALENVQRIARNQPALVIGGGLAAGLIIGRILRGGAEAATATGTAGSDGPYAGTAGSSSGVSSVGQTGYSTAGSAPAAGAPMLDDGGADPLSDSPTGDAARDEAPTARTTSRSRS